MSKRTRTIQKCPTWAAEFRSFQAKQANLVTKAEAQMTKTLNSNLPTLAKCAELEPIADELCDLTAQLEKFSTTLIPREVLRLKEALEKDYQTEIAKWHWYPQTRVETDGSITNLGPILQKDAETGRPFYVGDYDGRTESVGNGQDFTGEKFYLPTLAEILLLMEPYQMRLYNEMLAFGDKPKLQLVPVALELGTLVRAIDARKDDFGIDMSETFLSPEILDSELQYEPESFQASADGDRLKINGAKSKSEYIRKNKGWAVEIIATREDLERSDEISNAEKIEHSMQEALQAGYRSCTCESYISAQMTQLRNNPTQPLDNDIWIITPDSILVDQTECVVAYWNGDENQICLGTISIQDDHDFECFRHLIRLKR